MSWDLRRQRGDAHGFHQRDLPTGDARELWWFEVEQPTLVLGSTQRDDVVDRAAVDAGGVEVVRRRSGGAAVLLVPGETTWIDLVIPRHDPLWDDDVGRAAHWVGETWRATLDMLGVRGATVHLGGLERRQWSELVCFAGLGPGEVTVGAAPASSARCSTAGRRWTSPGSWRSTRTGEPRWPLTSAPSRSASTSSPPTPWTRCSAPSRRADRRRPRSSRDARCAGARLRAVDARPQPSDACQG